MPLYDFKCANGHEFERVVSLKDFDSPQFCACQLVANRVIRPVMFSVEKVEYDCPITGNPILSKKAHQENLDKHDCRVLETGEREQNAKNKQQADLELDKRVEATVEKAIDKMSGEERTNLGKELMQGTDLAIERKTAP